MSTEEFQFNQDDLTAWKNACEREGDLRRSGASNNELKVARMDAMYLMMNLLSPHMAAKDLASVLLATFQSFYTMDAEPVEGVEDPD